MLGAAVLAGVLAAIMAILLGYELVSKGTVSEPINGVLMIALLTAGAVASLRVHRKHRTMTPEERERYWQRLERHSCMNPDNLPSYYRNPPDVG
jgi:hypothetical protein